MHSKQTKRGGWRSRACALALACLPLAGAQAALPQGVALLAKPAATASAAAAEAPQSAADKLAAARQALAQLDGLESGVLPDGISPSDVLFRRALLERLVSSYLRLQDLDQEYAQSRKLRRDAEAEAAGWSGFDQPAPYPVALVESLRSRAQTGRWQMESNQAQQAMLGQMQDAARQALKAAEVALRQERERQEGDAASPLSRQWRLDGARWRRDISACELLLFDRLGQVLQVKLGALQAQMSLWQKQLARIDRQVSFQPADLQAVQARLARERQALERKMAAAEGDRRRQQADLAALEAEAATLSSSRNAADQARSQDLTQRTTEKRQALDNSDLAVQLLRTQLETNSQESGIWRYRYQLYAGKAGNVDEVAAASGQAIKELDAIRDYLQKESALVMSRIADLRHGAGGNASAMMQLYRQRLDILASAQLQVQAALSAILLLQEEFDVAAPDQGKPQEARRQLSERLSSAWRAVWNYELFSADDSVEINGQKVAATRSVTIGKSLGAILVLLIGYGASTAVLRALKRLAIRKLGVREAAANSWWRWAYVFVIALLVIFALNLVKIPLTVFAFLGGALAIGIGFGTQNLLKNLISGIMLLIERPLKVGDFVQVGGVSGTVAGIGLRSSVVRAADGVETLIPNATFVESAVTNWNYSSSRIRRQIAIGVAYGSPPRQVSDILLAEAGRHGQLLQEPAPRVLFSQFGDNALEFELEYWLDMDRADSRQVASDLRHMIAAALERAGIELPFPQRDVHLRQQQPLQIQVSRGRSEPAA